MSTRKRQLVHLGVLCACLTGVPLIAQAQAQIKEQDNRSAVPAPATGKDAAKVRSEGDGNANDDDALALADAAPEGDQKASKKRDWRMFLELAAGHDQLQASRGGGNQGTHRLAFDVAVDTQLAPGWHVLLADRIDQPWPAQLDDQHTINTLKEAYLSWHVNDDHVLDLGRINVRNGVATGYNPTDYFRQQAVRAAISADPATTKENRLGSVMLRTQSLWTSGSLTFVYAPRLQSFRNENGWNLDFAATNHVDRMQLALSQRWGSLTPQFLLTHAQGETLQWGANLTALVNDATVVFIEWSGTSQYSQWVDATRTLAPQTVATETRHWRQHVSPGISYTTPGNLTLTAEYHYNGAAPDSAQWQALQRSGLPLYINYRNWVQDRQELTTRGEWFLYVNGRDLWLNHLDLTGMLNLDAIDHSRRIWVEARYHAGQNDYAVKWQAHQGNVLSTFGAAPQRWSVEALLRHYF